MAPRVGASGRGPGLPLPEAPTLARPCGRPRESGSASPARQPRAPPGLCPRPPPPDCRRLGEGREGEGTSRSLGPPAFSLYPVPRRRAEPRGLRGARGVGGGDRVRLEPRGDPELPNFPWLRGAGDAPKQGELWSRKTPARCRDPCCCGGRDRVQAARRAGEREPSGLPPPAPGAASARSPPASLRLRGPGDPPRRPSLVSSPSPFGGGGGAGERGARRAHLLAALLLIRNCSPPTWLRAGFARPLSFRLCPVPRTDRCSQQLAGDFSPLPRLPRVPTPSFLPRLHPHPHHFGTAQDLFKPWETGSGPGFALILFKNWRHRRGL